MSINFNYEIISVDEQARCMEVIYTAEGHPTQHIGARLPYEGEPLEAVIRMYAPIGHWEQLKLTVSIPSVGASGAIPLGDEVAQAQSEEAFANARMLEQIQFEQRIAAVLVKFKVLDANPTVIPVSNL
jgi:hypothetical protein